MNSNQIHIYEDYAIAPYGKPNGNAFVHSAIRLKVSRVFAEREAGALKDTGYVEGFHCDHENGNVLGTTLRKYRTRDVISDWDEYEDQKDLNDLVEAKKRKQQEVRELQRREQVQRLNDRLKSIGIFEAEMDPYTQRVTMSFKSIQEWLDTLERSKCNTCGKEQLLIPR